MTRLNRRQTMALMGAAGLAPMAPAILRAQDKPAGLPDTMIWSTYDVGSTGYVEATAIADAMIKNYGTRVRLLPSGSGVGRIIPLKQGQANTAWLANELYFATRGIFDFATPEWGPQNMRTICGRPASFGIAVTQESGIETIEDLRGKRVAY
ncbi:MAG: TAXI family TRAP transporter solute-binding subunit, partial [Pseudooceanicola nanhaiensis]